MDTFVFDIIGILGHEVTKYQQFVEAIKIFKRYLRSDPKIFKRFKAATIQIKAMNIRKHVRVSKEHDAKIN